MRPFLPSRPRRAAAEASFGKGILVVADEAGRHIALYGEPVRRIFRARYPLNMVGLATAQGLPNSKEAPIQVLPGSGPFGF